METITKEDYLRAIYHIYEESNTSEIKSVDIQNYLNISKSSVSEMMKKLSNEKYIKADPYKKIKLTKKGKAYGIEMTRKHRIIEVFLEETLKIDKNKVHEEAHKLEHSFSNESIEAIYNLINNKTSCPHGKKIPQINK